MQQNAYFCCLELAEGRFATIMRVTIFLFPLVLAVIGSFSSCVPPEYDSSQRKVSIDRPDLRDPQVRKLYNWRDERRTDSLIAYLNHPNPALRYLAALSFASVRDSAAIENLAPLLNDKVEEIRVAAAFSLGQIGSPRAVPLLTNAFRAADSLSVDQLFNATVLEAVGKCGGPESLKHIASVTTYEPTDTLLLIGQCRALYRFGLRGITDPTAVNLAVSYVANTRIPSAPRLMAAHYLARADKISPDSVQSVQLAAAFVRSSDPEIRMALARALGRTKAGPAFAILSKVIISENDWRVKCDIIKSLADFPYDTVRSLVIPLILDPNPHVSRTAAEFFIQNGAPKDGDYYWKISRDNPNLPWEARVALFHASNKWFSGRNDQGTKDYINSRLREQFIASKNPYERAACLLALSENGWQYKWIHDRGFRDANQNVKTSAVRALRNILANPNFYGFFTEYAKGVRREIYAYLRETVNLGDPGMIVEAAPALEIPLINYRSLRDSLRIPDFYKALDNLKMPRDYEAYTALAKTIAFFEYKPAPQPPKNTYNHPIDWERLKVVTENTRVTFRTSRGDIVMELLPQWAPNTVASFLEQVSRGYFNGTFFHRIDPNFVVQGGDPRGDSYGGPDYSLRTEIGLINFNVPGVVGMASAGFDTEGAQFFFTHSPTPHLDGKYTIFARIISGNDLVSQLLLGDILQQASIQY